MAVLDAHGRIGVGTELCARNSLALRIRVKCDITAALATNIFITASLGAKIQSHKQTNKTINSQPTTFHPFSSLSHGNVRADNKSKLMASICSNERFRDCVVERLLAWSHRRLPKHHLSTMMDLNMTSAIFADEVRCVEK